MTLMRLSRSRLESIGKRIVNHITNTRESLGAAFVVTVLIVVSFLPLFSGKNFLPFGRYPNWGWADARNNGVPLKLDEAFLARKKVIPWVSDMDFGHLSGFFAGDYYTAQCLRSGSIPLWDPFSGCGYPTFDSGQYRPFNPFKCLFYFSPTYWTYCLCLLLGLFFGSLGAFLWLRREHFTLVEATLGAAIFVVNPWVLDRLTIMDPNAFFVLPWALLGLHQVKSGNWRSISLAAIPFVLMGNMGQPEPCLVVTAVVSAHFLFLGNLNSKRYDWLKRVKILGLVGFFSALALSIHWIPLLRLYNYGFSYKKLALSVVVPYSWKGFFTLASDLFVAPAILALAAAALGYSKGRVRFWWMVMAIVLLIIMPWPWFGYHIQRLLQVYIFAIPLVYFKGLFWTSLAYIAPVGLRTVTVGKLGPKLAAAIVGLLVFVGDSLLPGILPSPLSDQSRFPLIAFILISVGLGALLLVVYMPRRFNLAAGLMLTVLIVLPVAFPLSLNHLYWNRMTFQRGGLPKWLKQHYPNDRTVSPASLGFVIPPNEGTAYGVRCSSINTVFFLGRYFQFFFIPPAPPTLIAFRNSTSLLLRQTGATLLLAPMDTQTGLGKLVESASGSNVFTLPGAAGRLYYAWKSAYYNPTRTIGEQVAALGNRSDGVAVVEAMGQPAPAVWPTIPADEGRLTFVRDDIDKIVIESNAPTTGLLVLRDSWYPGWRAFEDGKITPIYRVNGCFRGVVVPEGKHVVRFVYRPLLVYASGIVSLLTTLFLFLMILIRRKEPVDAGPSPVGA